jgi:hypothetical protein
MSSDTFDMVQAARRCVEAAWPNGQEAKYGFTKTGVMLDELLPIEDRPRTLFGAPREKSAAAMMALNHVNDNLRVGSLCRGSGDFLSFDTLRLRDWCCGRFEACLTRRCVPSTS